jgi:hypothetical protein
VFTGPHATDITYKLQRPGAKGLYDIQTGSLVSPPSVYRIITLTLDDPVAGNTLEIHTNYVKNFNPTIQFPQQIVDPQSGLPVNNPTFQEFSKFRLAECVDRVVPYPEYRNAFMAHVAGNEVYGPAQQNEYNTLKTKMQANLNATLASVVDLQTDINTDDYNPPKFSF